MIYKDISRIYDSSRTCLTNNNRDYMRSRGLLFLHMDILHSYKITPIGQLDQEMTKKTNLMFSKKLSCYDVLSAIRLKIHKLMWCTFSVTKSILTVILMIINFFAYIWCITYNQDQFRSSGMVWISLHLLISCENPSSTH